MKLGFKGYLDDQAMRTHILGDLNPGFCKYCNRDVDHLYTDVPSHTQYHWDGKGEDPNADFVMCHECADYHLETMESQWADYYSGIL